MTIDFYTRAGCHLCDDAKALLDRLAQRRAFQVRTHDVDSDPALAERHGNEVPVLVVAGQKRFWGKIEPALLERFLEHELKR